MDCITAPPARGEVAGRGIDGSDELVGPGPEPWLVLAGHAEQLADDGDRERIGDLIHQVSLVAAGQVIDQAADDLGHFGRHRHDPVRVVRRSEVPHQQPAYPVVLWRVE